MESGCTEELQDPTDNGLNTSELEINHQCDEFRKNIKEKLGKRLESLNKNLEPVDYSYPTQNFTESISKLKQSQKLKTSKLTDQISTLSDHLQTVGSTHDLKNREFLELRTLNKSIKNSLLRPQKSVSNSTLQVLQNENQNLRQKLKMKTLNITIIRNDVQKAQSDHHDLLNSEFEKIQLRQAQLGAVELEHEQTKQQVLHHKNDLNKTDRNQKLLTIKEKATKQKLELIKDKGKGLRNQLMEVESVLAPKIEALHEKLDNQKVDIADLQQQYQKTDQENELLKKILAKHQKMAEALKGYVKKKEKLRKKYASLTSDHSLIDPSQNPQYMLFKESTNIDNAMAHLIPKENSFGHHNPEILSLLEKILEVTSQTSGIQVDTDFHNQITDICKVPKISKEISEISKEIDAMKEKKSAIESKIQTFDDEIGDLNEKLQNKESRIKELQELLDQSTEIKLRSNHKKNHKSEADISLTSKKLSIPMRLSDLTEPQKADVKSKRVEEWTNKYKKLFRGAGKVKNIKTKVVNRKEPKPHKRVVTEILKGNPEITRSRSGGKLRNSKGIQNFRSFNMHKEIRKTPKLDKLMIDVPPLPILSEAKTKSIGSNFLSPNDLFRYKLEPKQYYDDILNPFRTRNHKNHMKTGSHASSRRSPSCSSRKSSMWSEVTVQPNFQEILDKVNEMTDIVKFTHIQGNMFQYGTKQVYLIHKSKCIYARTGGGYIKVKEYLRKNKTIEERKLFGKGHIKRLNFANISKRKKFQNLTPRDVPTIKLKSSDTVRKEYSDKILDTIPDDK
ncbi:unnamed protein product [Moneuplotes crassus]|uniref:Uncharacterized protein n=1 Tax=Euplotes crassus TaxID=5936 RepID=A0AAD2D7A6_EUPCR|nr:unnamed protein product [Moneuplotes crassus]